MLVVILTLPNTVTQLIKHILKNWALRTKDNMKQIYNPWLPWCWINFFTEFLPTSSTKLFTIGFDFHAWGWCHFEFRQPGVPAMLDMLRSPGTPKASPLLSLEVEKPSLEVKEVLPLLQHDSFKKDSSLGNCVVYIVPRTLSGLAVMAEMIVLSRVLHETWHDSWNRRHGWRLLHHRSN